MSSQSATKSAATTARKIVFQCPRCHTTLRVDGATAGTTLNCEGCEKLIRVPGKRTASKAPAESAPTNPKKAAELKRCLKENESQRTEVTNQMNQLNIQLHRWQLRLQTLNERKQQLEKELASFQE
jgi:TolA-binding protein